MPELPEVETVVRTLRPLLVGRQIRRVQLQRADILTPEGTDLPAHLLDRTVTAITRRAKRIIIELDDANRFYVHLGMTGRLTCEPNGAPLEKHTHLILDTGDYQVRFRDPRRFGGIWWLGREGFQDSTIGPEPFGLRTAMLKSQLAKTTRPIKSALLDQSVIAGLGNIYVDESLFAARIHPMSPAHRLTGTEAASLNRAIKTVLRKAINHRGSTLRDYRDAKGEAGGFQLRHKVYARAGKPCRVCGAEIQRIVLGGRSTHFCPTCQVPSRKPA